MGNPKTLGVGQLLLCAVQFVDVLGVTSATTAIPAISAELGAVPVEVIAIAAAYATFFGGFLVLGARAGDRWGPRPVLVLALGSFSVVAVVGATAASAEQVAVARALQGLTAALSIPGALRLLLHLAPDPERRSTAVAAWSAAGAAAGAAGFLLGGIVTDLWSWRGIFWVNVPVGVALAVLIARTVPDAPRPTERAVRLDLGGAVLLAGAVMLVVGGAAVTEHADTRPAGIGAVALGSVLGLLFVVQQRRSPDGLIPPAAFRSRTLRLGTALSFVNTTVTSSSAVVLTLYVQQQQGASALEAGLQLLPLSLAVIAGSAIATPLSRHWPSTAVARAGLAVISAGTIVLVLALVIAPSGSTRALGFSVGVILIGLGLGPASVAATTIGTEVPEPLAGTATGVINTAAQLGTAIGIAFFLALAAAVAPQSQGTITAWIAIAALASGGILLPSLPPLKSAR